MQMSERNPVQFRFRDPHQQKIYEDLKDLVTPAAAAFFWDACWMMENPNLLQTTCHLVAHCLREIESAIRSVLKPLAVDEADKGPKPSSQKNEIERILKFLRIPQDAPEASAWFKLAKELHRFAHRRGLEAPRSAAEVRQLWESAQLLLRVLLNEIRNRFLEWVPLLDELLAKAQPTKRDIRRLANEVPNNTIFRRYFFDRLENPEWIEPLRERGFFKNPPAPEHNEAEDTIFFPAWPEGKYLARMARHKPDLVADIIREMHDTENVAVQIDLIDAMLAMPADVAARLLDKVKKWAESPRLYLLLPEKLGELISHLAKGGKADEAMAIGSALLDVLPGSGREQSSRSQRPYEVPPEPQARFDPWYYEQILRKYLPELVQSAGIAALELLCELLAKAIRLSRGREDDEGPEDYSCIWWSAIEDQNIGRTIKDALVSGVRDAALLAVRSGNATVQEVVECLERQSWKVFKRIALYVLAECAEQAMPLVAQHLTDRKLFDDVSLRHEFGLLLRKCFPRLSREDQQTILDWIKEGPEIEDLRWLSKQTTGDLPSDKEIARYRDTWQRDWLATIGADNLPEEWRERYKMLCTSCGEPKDPRLLPHGVVVSVRLRGPDTPNSPKTADELKEMSVEDIARFLRTWVPVEEGFGRPSPEGLGRILTSVVSEDPQRFASAAQQFKGQDPTYVRALLDGLREGLKKGKIFDWGPVLGLCQWVVKQPREIPGRQVPRMFADPHWGWTRKTIAALLAEGFDEGPCCIPIGYREEVWTVLKPLTDDPDPTPAQEKPDGGWNMDPTTLSINTTRGEALHAVVRYALWVRRYLEKKPDAAERISRGFAEMPEVQQVLDAHLDKVRDPSLAVHSVYGWRFPWFVLLDPDWARKNVSRIFPLDKQANVYFEAAWNAYLAFCQPYDNVFALLRDQYEHAVEQIGSPRDKKPLLRDPDERLAEHLMVYYWRARIDLQDPLWRKFWEKATDPLRAHAIEFVGRSLLQTEEQVPSVILDRLRKLWEDRFSRSKEGPADHEKEISAFGWWFVSEKFDANWSITQLSEALQLIHKTEPAHMVLEQLAKTVETHPRESVKCLRMIAEGDRNGWLLYANRKSVRRILEVALQQPSASEEAKAVINYLGSRGFLEFKDLLT